MEISLKAYASGAAAVTDLVNTEAGHRQGDRLTNRAELAAFLDDHGMARTSLTDGDLVDARQLREELLALFSRPDDDLPAALAALYEDCPHRLSIGPQHLDVRTGDWRLRCDASEGPVVQLRLLAGVSLLAALAALGPGRFRDCASPTCTGRFVDTSPTGRRRFCTPAVCGNRVNVARYRARRASGGGDAAT